MTTNRSVPKGIKYALIAAALCLSVSQVRAAVLLPCVSQSLANYISVTDGCMIDGLLFSHFRYLINPLSGAPTAVPANQVNVTPNTDSNHPGLKFEGPWSAVNSAIDYLIFYDVDTASGSATISNAYLDWEFSRTGVFSGVSLDEFLCVGDTLLTGCLHGASPRFYLRDSIMPGTPSNSIGFTPTSHVSALKDIFLSGVSGSAQISSATNQWGQVPEPGTVALTIVGLVFLALTQRVLRSEQ